MELNPKMNKALLAINANNCLDASTKQVISDVIGESMMEDERIKQLESEMSQTHIKGNQLE